MNLSKLCPMYCRSLFSRTRCIWAAKAQWLRCLAYTWQSQLLDRQDTVTSACQQSPITPIGTYNRPLGECWTLRGDVCICMWHCQQQFGCVRCIRMSCCCRFSREFGNTWKTVSEIRHSAMSRSCQMWAAALNKHCFLLSRISILTRDIDIANLSVCPSVRLSDRNVPVSDENGLTYRHSFSPYGSPIILVLSASNTFTKFRWGHPLQGR